MGKKQILLNPHNVSVLNSLKCDQSYLGLFIKAYSVYVIHVFLFVYLFNASATHSPVMYLEEKVVICIKQSQRSILRLILCCL